MIRAIDLAKYIISKCSYNKNYITNQQLQRLLYYIQYDCLINTNQPLFLDDIEAWGFGVVIPKVYDYFSFWNTNPINYIYNEYENLIKESYIKYIIDNIITFCVSNDQKLIHEINKENGAWHTIHIKFNAQKIIPLNLIKKHILNIT